jgi:hypothetical protein
MFSVSPQSKGKTSEIFPRFFNKSIQVQFFLLFAFANGGEMCQLLPVVNVCLPSVPQAMAPSVSAQGDVWRDLEEFRSLWRHHFEVCPPQKQVLFLSKAALVEQKYNSFPVRESDQMSL